MKAAREAAAALGEDEDEVQEEEPKTCLGILRARFANLASSSNTPVINELLKLEQMIVAPPEVDPAWIKSAMGDTFFGVVIILNSVMIGVDVDLTGPAHPDAKQNTEIFWVIETIFLIIFLAEMALRVRSDGFRRYIRDPWGAFDFTVTFLGCIDAWIMYPVMGGNEALDSVSVLRTLRLIRLIRLVRVFRMFKELVLLIRVMVSSFRALWWMCFLLIIVLYASAVLLVVTIGVRHAQDDEDVDLFFGSVMRAMFWQLCVVTGEGWVAICDVTLKYSEGWLIYWIFMMVLLNFSMLNLMVGLIVSRIMRLATEDDEALTNFVADSTQFRRTMMALFAQSDMDDSGALSMEEMTKLLEMKKTRDVLETFGIKADLPTNFLIQMLGFDDETQPQPKFEDIFEACKRLCGSKNDLRSFFLQNEIHVGHVRTRQKCVELERKLDPLLKDPEESASPIAYGKSGSPGAPTERPGQTSPGPPPQKKAHPSPAPAPPVVEQIVDDRKVHDADGPALYRALDQMTNLESRQDQVFKAIDELKKRSANATVAAQAVNNAKINGNGFSAPLKPAILLDGSGKEVQHLNGATK